MSGCGRVPIKLYLQNQVADVVCRPLIWAVFLSKPLCQFISFVYPLIRLLVSHFFPSVPLLSVGNTHSHFSMKEDANETHSFQVE